MIAAHEITGLVLAGGQGMRMGGADKGLLPLAGRPLAWHALERLRPQVGPLAISANRNLQAYRALGVPVWTDGGPTPRPDMDAGSGPDIEPDIANLGPDLAPAGAPSFSGPLDGVLAGLSACRTDWLAVVPCDAPFFPQDLVARLAAGISAQDGQAPRMAVACGREGPEPVFCLLHRQLREPLARFLSAGGRRAGDWAREAGAVRVAFDRPGLDARAFLNLNRLTDLEAAEAGPFSPA